MIAIDIPGGNVLQLEHLVMDYNGTLAVDGTLIAGVVDQLKALGHQLKLHVITADTFGNSSRELEGLDVRHVVIGTSGQDRQKEDYVVQLGPGGVVAIGNGRNDLLMLKKAALGICLVQAEGMYAPLFGVCAVVCTDVRHALDLLVHPLRLKATLRM
jgi:soluble P-type ATPase